MENLPSLTPEFSRPLSLRRLPRADTHRFTHPATPDERAAVAEVLEACTADPAGRAAVGDLLGAFDGGPELLDLDRMLAGCRIRKEGGRLFSVPA